MQKQCRCKKGKTKDLCKPHNPKQTPYASKSRPQRSKKRARPAQRDGNKPHTTRAPRTYHNAESRAARGEVGARQRVKKRRSVARDWEGEGRGGE